MASTGLILQFNVVLDDYAIQPRGNAGVANFGSIGSPSWRGKPDIVGLPNQRWQRHIHSRRTIPVQRPGTVKYRTFAERIENLALISSLDINATVATSLVTCFGHVRQAKLQMQIKILMHRLEIGPLDQQPIFSHLAIDELIGIAAVEQHDCPFGRFGGQGWAATNDAVKLA